MTSQTRAHHLGAPIQVAGGLALATGQLALQAIELQQANADGVEVISIEVISIDVLHRNSCVNSSQRRVHLFRSTIMHEPHA